MASSPRLIVTQKFIFNNSRKLYRTTLQKAAYLANDHATDVQVKLLLKDMSTEIITSYKSYTDKYNHFDAMVLTQEIMLTDDRRKYMTRLAEIADEGSVAAIEKFTKHTPAGCISETQVFWEYQRIWYSGTQSYEIS